MEEHTPEAKREFMLAALRRASAEHRSDALHLDEIGVSLKLNMIDAEGAVTWLNYIGALDCINVPPWTNRIEVAA